MSIPAYRFARVNGPDVDWQLKRNCSLTPSQMGWLFGSLFLVSQVIGLWFWWQGARFVLGFAWIELVAVGLAFLTFARHAADRERITLRGARLVVELERAGRLQRAEFDCRWVRVEPRGSEGSLIEVSGQGKTVEVGRFVRPEWRPVLAREIRMALRTAA